jgi:hypothetical protein
MGSLVQVVDTSVEYLSSPGFYLSKGGLDRELGWPADVYPPVCKADNWPFASGGFTIMFTVATMKLNHPESLVYLL